MLYFGVSQSFVGWRRNPNYFCDLDILRVINKIGTSVRIEARKKEWFKHTEIGKGNSIHTNRTGIISHLRDRGFHRFQKPINGNQHQYQWQQQ